MTNKLDLCPFLPRAGCDERIGERQGVSPPSQNNRKPSEG